MFIYPLSIVLVLLGCFKKYIPNDGVWKGSVLAAAVCNFSSVGQLKPGYHADFIVLDKDIFSISPEDIDKVSVDETFIGGEKIYKRENQ